MLLLYCYFIVGHGHKHTYNDNSSHTVAQAKKVQSKITNKKIYVK